MAIGTLAGGFFIRSVKPGPRLLTSLIFGVELFANAGILAGFFLGCPGSTFFGYGKDAAAKYEEDVLKNLIHRFLYFLTAIY